MQDLLRANKVVIKAKSEHVVLRYQSFDDLRNLKLLTYNDSSFGNLKDGGLQGAFVIFIVDPAGNCSSLMWQSRKLRRVVKSAMAAETLVQVDAAEAAFWLAKLLNEIFYDSSTTAPQTKIECFTDSYQLYDVVLSVRCIKDRRLRIDIAILQEMLKNKEIFKIEWVDSSHQLADSLTKAGASSAKLMATLKSGRL